MLVTAAPGTVDDADVELVGRRVNEELQHQPYVSNVTSYFVTQAPTLRSKDQRSALVLARVGAANADKSNAHLPDLISSLARLSNTAATVQSGGQSGTNVALTGQIGKDLRLKSIVAVPVTVVLLFFVFGGLLAVLLPLAIAAFAIMGTFAELHVLTFFTDVSIYAIDLNIALGLGLAVDYGLLYVSRYREEIASGLSVEDALARASATAGLTVLFSGVTVALALAALLVFPVYFLRSFGYAGIGVVVFAVLGALIVLPALLAAFGDRVAHGRRPSRTAPTAGAVPASDTAPQPRRSGRTGLWRKVAVAVTARPIVAALPVVAILVVIGLPLLNVHFASPDDRALRSSTAAQHVGNALRTDFNTTSNSQLNVVATSGKPVSGAALTRYTRALSRLPGAQAVQGPTGTYQHGERVADDFTPGGPPRTAGHDYFVTVANRLDPTSAAAATLVRQVRAVPSPTGSTALVGGAAAALVDQKHVIGSALPWAAVILVLASFIMLFLFLGSLLIPLKALVLNALTLFAVVGAMIWVFQDGHLAGVLGFTPADTTTTIPPLLFVIAFALSMDYEVFLISRIKEMHDHGHDNHDAVVEGMAGTGSIVTTAAALLCVTFFAFGLSKISFLQFFGIGTGLAILLDAFVVRGILVPAVMQLFGERAWWAPRSLAALHRRIGIKE